MKAREADVGRLDAEIQELDGPLNDRLAVIPSWVRSQVSNLAGLLSDAPERVKSEFQRLGVSYTVSIVLDEGPRPFLRAVGTTDLSSILAGSGTDFTTVVGSDQRLAP